MKYSHTFLRGSIGLADCVLMLSLFLLKEWFSARIQQLAKRLSTRQEKLAPPDANQVRIFHSSCWISTDTVLCSAILTDSFLTVIIGLWEYNTVFDSALYSMTYINLLNELFFPDIKSSFWISYVSQLMNFLR